MPATLKKSPDHAAPVDARASDPAVPYVPGAAPAGDAAIRRTTVATVVVVALIAAFVSYRHIRAVSLAHGEDPINAAVIPLSVDGLIVVASMTMLADSRAGRGRHWLAYLILVLGSAASLAANVMHAEPTLPARIIAGWPSAALIGTYELLMRQIRAGSPRPTRLVAPGNPADPAPSARTAPSSVAPSPTGGAATTGAATGVGQGRWVPTKKERLRLLLAEQVGPGDRRTIYALARDLAPQIDLHPGTARRYLPDLIAERRALAGPARGKPPDPSPSAGPDQR